MACDRFVYFKDKPVPSKEDIGKALEDYLGGVADSVEWQRDRFFACIHGAGSNPFKRLSDRAPLEEDDRWIEVHIGDDNIDVITRRQDELTNTIAFGFARLVARFWHGVFKEEGLGPIAG